MWVIDFADEENEIVIFNYITKISVIIIHIEIKSLYINYNVCFL